ncbi:MAG: hypothetical protein KDE27_15425 [Planctomycetes bacterium]|nr:hypothetical protein [Planctomycetota bacterium]
MKSDFAGSDAADTREATVIGRLPNEMFRLRLEDGREVDAHAAQNLRMAYVRLVPSDVVAIEISPFDPNKARIVRLLRQQHLRRQQQPTPTPRTEPDRHPKSPSLREQP